MHKSKLFGKLISALGVFLIALNLFFPTKWNGDPKSSSVLGNQLYYAFSRVSFVFAAFLIFLAIVLGHWGTAKAMLSNNINRMIAKSLAIGCVVQILIIELLFESNATPDGLYLTYPIALLFGLGF